MIPILLGLFLNFSFAESSCAGVERPERRLLSCFFYKSKELSDAQNYQYLGSLLKEYKKFYLSNQTSPKGSDFFESSLDQCKKLKSTNKIDNETRMKLILNQIPAWSAVLKQWIFPEFDQDSTKISGVHAGAAFGVGATLGVAVQKSFQSDGRRIYYVGPSLGILSGIGGFVGVRPEYRVPQNGFEFKNSQIASLAIDLKLGGGCAQGYFPGFVINEQEEVYANPTVGLAACEAIEVSAGIPFFAFRNWSFIKDQILNSSLDVAEAP